ncbi:putative small metal-binding protein [Embleya sp. AB8]
MNPVREDTMRKVADCREYPSESGCTLTIAGSEEEVLVAAAQHAQAVHGHTDSPELREELRKLLKDEEPGR